MISVRQVKVLVSEDNLANLKKKTAQKLKISESEIEKIEISKKAVDARDKRQVFFSYEVDCSLKNEKLVLKKNRSQDIFSKENTEYKLPAMGEEKLKDRIIIVGSGPAGMFASYILAEAGFKPLIIERGKPIAERIKDVEEFWQSGILNPESNVQFGEGGAGTFSDGKLNTLIKDKRHLSKKVFDVFGSCGAPAEIKYLHNPHIGTDNLRIVMQNMHEKIIAMGGEFRYSTKLTDLIIKNSQLVAIKVNAKEEIPCQNLILAIGHSARDTFKMLDEKHLKMAAKPFAVGLRVMHNQKLINENQYGKFAKYLPNASYKLTYTTKENRGVYSFCMCPGGYVVNASSETGRLAINGMSNYQRDSAVANSALVVTVTPNDLGNNIFAGLKFQQDLETKAYNLAQGKIPLQLWQDFQNNQESVKPVKPIMALKGNYDFKNIRQILPSFVSDALIEAMPYFGTKIKDFDHPQTILAAIESRTSSPIRIIRDTNFEANIKGIYPCGEGAGYAGGITTSAIDGIKVAEIIIQKYKI